MNGRADGISKTQLIRNTGGPGCAAWKLAAVAATGAAVALLAAGCSSGRPSGLGSASSGISPAQAITLASQQAKRATSFSSSVSMRMSGIVSGAMAGTLEMRTRPLLFDADFSTMNVGGQSVPGGIEEILTGHTLYLKMPALAQRFGKPWVKFSFAGFQNSTGMSLAQIIQQAQQNNPLVQMQMLAGAKDVRVAGHQVIDGVPTTHYTGTYTAAAALAGLPSSLRATEQKGLQTLGVTSVQFSVWIDSLHQARKIVAYETGASERATITLTVTGINQPITVTLPPASQVATIPASTLRGRGAAAPGSSTESVRIGPYTQVFATPMPANPAQAKVIAGFREAQTLWEKSDYAWHLAAPVKEYVTGQALTHLVAAVTASRAHHLVPAGTERFFLTHVSDITDSTATVTTCDDGSKVKEENRQTGATYTTPPGQAYIFETWHMVKLSGHWGITAFSLATPPSPRAAPCQP